MSHRYAVDSLLVRGSRCFGWGWFLDDAQPARHCEIRVPLASGEDCVVACIPGGMRQDLRDAYPGVSHAAAAGFLIHGRVDQPLAVDRKPVLVAVLADGSTRTGELPPSLFTPGDGPAAQWPARVARLVRALYRRDTEPVGSRVPVRVRERLSELATRLSRVRRLRALRSPSAATVLVLDHGMGGGANQYRNVLVGQLVGRGRPVVVVSPLLAPLQYGIEVHTTRGVSRWRVDDLAPMLAMLERLPRLDVHVNDLVSYEDPVALMDWCRRVRAANRGELVMHLHDYHAVCPAWTLIGVDGAFCNVPTPDVCRQCLPRNAVNTLGFSQAVPIDDWRGAWGTFLATCDRIVAFSHASVAVLRRAYPALVLSHVTVEPHQVDTTELRPTHAVPGPPLVIAVAGHVSVPKGALMLREMAAIIRRERRAMRIVVFGTLEQHDPSDGIEVHGAYTRAQLPELLERHGVGVCMLPSICAETFSFVTAEYMAMEMPVAVFPIGAPAERVAGYHSGLVISRIDAQAAVEEIAAFAARLWPEARPATSIGS